MKYLLRVAGPRSEGCRCTWAVSLATSGQVRASVSMVSTAVPLTWSEKGAEKKIVDLFMNMRVCSAPTQRGNTPKTYHNIKLTSSVASAARLTTNTLGSMGLSATAGGLRPSTSPERVTAGSRQSGEDRSTSKELNS